MAAKKRKPTQYRTERTLNRAFQQGRIDHNEFLKQSRRLAASPGRKKDN